MATYDSMLRTVLNNNKDTATRTRNSDNSIAANVPCSAFQWINDHTPLDRFLGCSNSRYREYCANCRSHCDLWTGMMAMHEAVSQGYTSVSNAIVGWPLSSSYHDGRTNPTNSMPVGRLKIVLCNIYLYIYLCYNAIEAHALQKGNLLLSSVLNPSA